VDIVDLGSSASTCKTFPRLPGAEQGVVGGLGFENEPLVCTGNKAETYFNDCYAYHEGNWTLSDKVNEVRGYAAVSESPYPKETHRLLLSGGSNGSGVNFTNILFASVMCSFSVHAVF
jgi:hypothetical protein